MRRPTTPPRRFGFTMVELLVVVLVLAILLGLLIPAVMRAVSTAKDAAVAAEINLMAQALADFKGKYGGYPPSRIVLHENGDYSPAALGNYASYRRLAVLPEEALAKDGAEHDSGCHPCGTNHLLRL